MSRRSNDGRRVARPFSGSVPKRSSRSARAASEQPARSGRGARGGRAQSARGIAATRGSSQGRSGDPSHRGGSSSRVRAVAQAAASQAMSNRMFVPLVIFLGIAAIFLLRLVYLQVIVAGDYSEQAQQARTSYLTIEPRRGTIYDRNGVVLATSVDATTIYVDPTEVSDPQLTAKALADGMGGNPSDYLDKITANNTRYSVIKRKADTSVGDAVKEDAQQVVDDAQRQENADAKDQGRDPETISSGIHFVSESRREYPNGQVAGQIVGAVNSVVDTDANREYYVGIAGLEQQYNDILSGTPGYYEAEYGRSGQAIPNGVHEEVAAVDGQDIVVSIDVELQRVVEEKLTSGVEALNGATGGNAVVMDGGTGEILAAASLPLFNPADRSDTKPDSLRLKSVTDLLEPGSIFKSVSATAIVDAGVMTPDSEIYAPASITADGYTISDAHERGAATFTLRQIIDQSSNVGISLATEKLGFETFYNDILRYNLHTRTGVDYPGEGEEGTDALGMLAPFDNWSKAQAYNISFGQGISVTPLQMTRFYGALVNGGVECVPHFLIQLPQTGEKPTYDTQKVIDNQQTIDDMQSMLKTVVTDGTGKKAAIDGYNVAGKTSTAEIYDEENGGYRKNVYNLAFTGFIADSSSQLVCFVGANEVPYDGVVTPIFKDIMSSAIDRFRISSE